MLSLMEMPTDKRKSIDDDRIIFSIEQAEALICDNEGNR